MLFKGWIPNGIWEVEEELADTRSGGYGSTRCRTADTRNIGGIIHEITDDDESRCRKEEKHVEKIPPVEMILIVEKRRKGDEESAMVRCSCVVCANEWSSVLEVENDVRT